MFLCIQCRDIEYRVLLAPLQFLSQLSIQSFSLLQISQLHIFFQFHFFIVLHCLGIIQLIFQLVFFSITFQRCGICDGWVPSTSPHAKCLCCLEQKRVSEHCAKNCCSKPQTHKYQHFKLQQCLLKETVESSSDPFSQWFWKSSVYQVETHCSVVSTEPPQISNKCCCSCSKCRVSLYMSFACLPCPYCIRGSHILQLSAQGSEMFRKMSLHCHISGFTAISSSLF